MPDDALAQYIPTGVSCISIEGNLGGFGCKVCRKPRARRASRRADGYSACRSRGEFMQPPRMNGQVHGRRVWCLDSRSTLPAILNRLPFLGHGNRSPRDGRLSVSIDLRCKHDRSLGEHAAELFGRGLGYKVVAGDLGIPTRTVRKWQQTYRAVGRGGLPLMGKTRARLGGSRRR